MEELSVPHFGRHLAVFKLKDADILGVGFAVQVILFDAGFHTLHIPFAATHIEGITIKDILNRCLRADLHVQAFFKFGQAFESGNGLFFLLQGHEAVIFFQILLEM